MFAAIESALSVHNGANWRTHATPQEESRLKEIEAALTALAPLQREKRKIYDRCRKRADKEKK